MTQTGAEKHHPRDPDFAILASQRTGSTMLVARLESHPALTCMGELFVRNAGTRIEALEPLPDRVVEEFSTVEAREERWRRFLREVARVQERRWGFKLMANQSLAVRRYLIRRTRAGLIVLKRDNVLAAFASGQIVQASQGREGVTSVPFRAKKFRIFMARYEERFAQIRAELEKAGRAHLATTYERLTGAGGDAENARILDFLGAAPHPLQSITAKRNSNDILSRFDNPDAVRACLDEIGRPEWATDHAATV